MGVSLSLFRYGQLKDDIERSVRFFSKDGGMNRFLAFHAGKSNSGQFKEAGGGISSEYKDSSTHASAGRANLEAIAQEFPDHVTLMEKTLRNNKGMTFKNKKARETRGLKRKAAQMGASSV